MTWIVTLLLAAALWQPSQAARAAPGDRTHEETMAERRLRMVETQIRQRGITDPRVLEAMETVPRHEFVPPEAVENAYQDTPLAIGHGQTISQPYIVALMSQMLALDRDDRVLEIGTGSGYQAAVLSKLAREVYSIEIVPELGESARKRLARLGYGNVTVMIGDGYKGWPEHAPFDAIIVTAAPPEVPQALVDQLADGGRMVVPVGTTWQELVLIERHGDEIDRRVVTGVRFVPMVHGDSTRTKPPR